MSSDKKDEIFHKAQLLLDEWKNHIEFDKLSNAQQSIIGSMVRTAMEEGYKLALSDFAWYKDGTQYVGCGFYTLADMLEELK